MQRQRGGGRKPNASTIANLESTRARLARLPTAPAFLSPVAKAEWRRMGRLLLDAGLLTNLDTVALALYCSAHAHYVEAEAMLQEHGSTTHGQRGGIVQSPYVAIANQAMAQMQRLLGEFGMTPAARSRIPKEQPPERHPRPLLNTNQPEVDPREALRLAVQERKN